VAGLILPKVPLVVVLDVVDTGADEILGVGVRLLGLGFRLPGCVYDQRGVDVPRPPPLLDGPFDPFILEIVAVLSEFRGESSGFEGVVHVPDCSWFVGQDIIDFPEV
jgi:hypothetical protein